MGLTSYRMVPPTGRWQYNAPPLIVGSTFEELITKVEAFRRSNGFSEEEISQTQYDVEEQICSLWPQGCQDGGMNEKSVFLSQRKFLSAVKSLLSGDLVSQEEAERRAKICYTCHNNVRGTPQLSPGPGGCAGCKKPSQFLDSKLWQLGLSAVKLLAPSLLQGKRTSLDSSLGQCALCGCLLKLKVWVKNGKNAFKGQENMWPSFCWMKDD